MRKLTTNFRALWFGSNRDIPADWSRDTIYDSLFIAGAPNGDDADTAQSGGSATHTQTIPVHGHDPVSAHKHPVAGASTTASSTTHSTGSPSVGSFAQPAHAHTGGFTSEESITYSNSSGADLTGASSPDQVYVSAIIIKPDDNNQLLPDDAVCFWDSADIPTDYQICDGDNDTPVDTDDCFVKGALPGIGGGDTGGTSSHSHTLGHTHATSAHIHSAWTDSGIADNVVAADFAAGFPKATIWAYHEQNQTDSLASYTSGSTSETTGSSSYLPLYYRLLAIQNQTGADSLLEGMILMFKGALADIPPGWRLYDSLKGKQPYLTTDTNEIGDAGGSALNLHTHGGLAMSHAHDPDAAHSHDNLYNFTTRRKRVTGAVTVARDAIGDTHTHVWTHDAVTSTAANTILSSSGTADIREPYIDILFIKKETEVRDIILNKGVITYARS